MSSEHQMPGDQELDRWLITVMAFLNAALDDVLDLDAGLADAQLSGLQSALVHNLDDVLDLDAGLSDIMSAPPPTSDAKEPADHVPTTPTLYTFAAEFAKRAPRDRLTARAWFPRQELAALRSITKLGYRAHTLGAVRGDDEVRALDEVRVLDEALILGNALTYARDAVRALNDARVRDAVRALDDAFACARDAVRARVRDADRAADDALALARATPGYDVIDAVDLLDNALTHMVGVDLTSVDLHGIPLAGVRWSHETRWPGHWEDQIRQNSVEVEPGLYEILPGTTMSIDSTLNAPTGNAHVTLRSTAVFDLLAPRTPAVPVKVELRYDTRDPYAVVAAFRTGRAGWVEWVFARDLLIDGLVAEAGNGDVCIRPAVDDPEIVVIELSSPSGHAVFEASAQEMEDFLDRTYDVVVPGNEHLWVDVDEALTHLTSTDMP